VVTGVPVRRGGAAFGVVCAILLAAGLIGLLVLNTALAQGSFTLQGLQSTSDQLADSQDALTQSLDVAKSPANLAQRATSMGMVPARSAAFLRLSDGKVIGVAEPAVPGSGFTVVRTTGSATPAMKPAKAKRAAVKPSTAAPAVPGTKPVPPASAAVRPATPTKR
jgi:hypothetical protein